LEGLNAALCTPQEKQECKLAPEIECERQVQRPPRAIPEPLRIHPHLCSFAAAGNLDSLSSAYQPVFHTLHNISAASFLNKIHIPSNLLATKDFAMTIKIPPVPPFIADAFQQPFGWNLRVGPILLLAPMVLRILVLIILVDSVTDLDVLVSRDYAGRQGRIIG